MSLWRKLFGPVLFYDLVCSARRSRYFLLRIGYASFLLFILFTAWLSVSIGARPGVSEIDKATRFASRYFENFIVAQLFLVVILTPAYVAGAIAEEKERKTLEFLLATDLRNREIVLSKFGARLASLTLFLITGLPILAVLQFLGGIDPNLVLAGFAVTGLTMLGIAAVGIFNSVNIRKARDAIGATYLFVVAYHAIGTTLYFFLRDPRFQAELSFPIWFSSDGAAAFTILDALHWINAGNPVAAILDIGEALDLPQLPGWVSAIQAALPGLLARYAIFHGVLTVVCLLLAIRRLRRVALRQAYGRVRQAAARRRKRPLVGELPMLWKETAVEGRMRLNWFSATLLMALFLFSMFFGVMQIVGHYFLRATSFYGFPEGMNIWVRTAGAAVSYLMFLGVAIRASTSVGNERDQQTLDTLLTTPLECGEMLWGKFLGAILSVRLAWIWLGLIWGMGVATGGLHVFSLILLVAAWCVYASFFAMLGLWFSITCKTTTRATIVTMLMSIGVTFGHWLIWLCCIPLGLLGGHGIEEGASHIIKLQFGMTPPFALGMIAYALESFEVHMNEALGASLFGVLAWAIMGILFWTVFLSPRFRIFCGRQEPSADGERPQGRATGAAM